MALYIIRFLKDLILLHKKNKRIKIATKEKDKEIKDLQ